MVWWSYRGIAPGISWNWSKRGCKMKAIETKDGDTGGMGVAADMEYEFFEEIFGECGMCGVNFDGDCRRAKLDEAIED